MQKPQTASRSLETIAVADSADDGNGHLSVANQLLLQELGERLGLTLSMPDGAVRLSMDDGPDWFLEITEDGAMWIIHAEICKCVDSTPAMLDAYPPAQAETILAALKNADLLGYVGHWNEAGELLGVHLGPDHQLGELVTDGVYNIDLDLASSDGAYRVDVDRLNASLSPLKARENWQALPYTGDYDLHDMISLYGQRATVPSNSDEEVRIINFINAYIAAFDKQRSFKSIEYNTVRHGAQVSYVAFARDKGEPIVPQVAESDFPLAFIYKGEWTIVRNREEHLAFYEKVGAKMKFPWLPRTETDNHRRDSR